MVVFLHLQMWVVYIMVSRCAVVPSKSERWSGHLDSRTVSKRPSGIAFSSWGAEGAEASVASVLSSPPCSVNVCTPGFSRQIRKANMCKPPCQHPIPGLQLELALWRRHALSSLERGCWLHSSMPWNFKRRDPPHLQRKTFKQMRNNTSCDARAKSDQQLTRGWASWRKIHP